MVCAEGGACEAGLLPVQAGDDCGLGCEICGLFPAFSPCCSDGPACEEGMFCIDSVEDFGRSMCVESCGGGGDVPCNGATLLLPVANLAQSWSPQLGGISEFFG